MTEKVIRPKSILDYQNPGWKKYSEEAEKFIEDLRKSDPELFKEVESTVKRLGLFGLWKAYYPALYEVAKLLKKGEEG